MRNLTVRTTMRALSEELDKIDPGWYNAEVGGEYRKFGGNIYNTGGANMTDPELLKHLHTIANALLQTCYVDTPMNPDNFEDAIAYLERVMPELREVYNDLGIHKDI